MNEPFGLDLFGMDDILHTVSQAKDAAAVRAALLDCAHIRPIRFLRFNFWSVRTDLSEPLWRFSTFPGHWPLQGPPCPDIQHDMVIRRIWDGILPLDWTTIGTPVVAAAPGPRQPKARDFPLIRIPALPTADLTEPLPFGVSIPVRGQHGTIGLLCACFRTDAEIWRIYGMTWTAKLNLLALQIQDRLERVCELGLAETQLTNREIQCVRLAARGKRSKEIAYELSLGEKTVNFYLSRARVKLKAANTTEAVVRASELGVLPVSYRFLASRKTTPVWGHH